MSIYLLKFKLQQIVNTVFIGFLLLILIYLTRQVFEQETISIDTTIYRFMINLRSELLTNTMIAISFIGEQIAVALALIITYYFFFKRNYRIGILIFLSTFLASVVTYFLKIVTARPRPEIMLRLVTENNFSFPSGHATTAFSVYPILLILFLSSVRLKRIVPNWIRILLAILLILLPIFVAISRLYLGVHYFSDVVAGAIIGLFFSYIFAILSYKKPAI